MNEREERERVVDEIVCVCVMLSPGGWKDVEK